jgi:hypothetical protein
MPCLNAAPFIEAALTTVLRQDYPALQCLVVDGGSTDGTLQVLERMMSQAGGRLRWVSRADDGPAQAVNAGFSAALRDPSVDVIGWLNADDGYAPGAVSRAVQALRRHPQWQMVYGRARHVDEKAQDLGPYPTLGPNTPIEAFDDGSFICQPTMFMRRGALQEAGALDESLATAFDFELWLRMFRLFKGRIGFVDAVQAYSRLHASCLTRRLREKVALEGLQVTARHLGRAPLHWVLTHVNELCAAFPFDGGTGSLTGQVGAFIAKAAPLLTAADRTALAGLLKQDQRLRLARGGAAVGVQPDGWVSHRLAVRLRWDAKAAASTLLLRCRGGWPQPGTLQLTVTSANGAPQTFSVDATREFTLQLRAPAGATAGSTGWVIETNDHFVPAQCERGSKDSRSLSFKVEGLSLSTSLPPPLSPPPGGPQGTAA